MTTTTSQDRETKAASRRAYYKAYYQKNKAHYQEYYRVNKDKHNEQKRAWAASPEGRKYNSRFRREYYAKLRTYAIGLYGGKCMCPGCTVTAPEFLTLDHTANDGHVERAGRLDNKIAYTRIWKAKRVLPEYQLLCWNCNCAKSVAFRSGGSTACPLAGQPHI